MYSSNTEKLLKPFASPEARDKASAADKIEKTEETEKRDVETSRDSVKMI